VEAWVSNQTAQVAASGAAEMAIPGISGVTSVAGMGFLLHKMGYCAWGIGALMGCKVLGKADLINVLRLWVDPATELVELDSWAVTAGLFERVTGDPAAFAGLEREIARLEALPGRLALGEPHKVQVNAPPPDPDETRISREEWVRLQTLRVLREAVEQSQGRHAVDVGAADASSLLSPRIGRRLALSLAADVLSQVPRRLIVGLVPVAGALFGAYANAQTMRALAGAAKKYYGGALDSIGA
jgi:hypothetical protein